ncbi:MAG TPA: methyltransferase domain-containing protein [Caulobacteraceae bacterium]|jgi:SAM-dependent methyltransferase
MRQDVIELREFYASPLGRAAGRLVGRKVGEAWGAVAGLDMLALGYAVPLLAGVEARRVIAGMPAAQGVEVWPAGAGNLSCLVDETALPFANALFDRVLAVHSLEESDNPLALLREVGRVLAPSGRLIVVVTARRGLWANAEGTPFGHGRPFSRRQLERLLREADLEPVGWTRALYAPPLKGAHRWAEPFERVGARFWRPFAGLILMEAIKQTFAVVPKAVRARARTIPILQPAPIARRSDLAA